MARRLAVSEGANLIITARREEKLLALKKELDGTASGIHIIPADLSSPEGVNRLFQTATQKESIYAVINNAGMTFYGHTLLKDLDTFDTIIRVNYQAVMHLNLHFLSYFKERGEGAILNITSLGGSVPMPYQSVYAASKHATQAFTESLYQENRKYKNITISCFAPGGIQTEMLKKSGLDQKIDPRSAVNMKADTVARMAINGFKKKRYFLVPGIMNKLTLFITRLVPRKWVTWGGELIYRPPVDE
jgi:short-subunit dehydrogenase